jgi:hypothetical protein
MPETEVEAEVDDTGWRQPERGHDTSHATYGVAVTYTAACPACGADAKWSGRPNQLVPDIDCPRCQPERNAP